MKDVVPTIVPVALADILSVRERYRSFLTALHVDVADGVFAPNTTWIPKDGEYLPNVDAIFYTAHLMVINPEATGLAFREAGARGLEAHVESASSGALLSTFSRWRAAGIEKIGLAFLLHTPLSALEPFLSSIDYVRLMTIPRIGTQGIPFEKGGIHRVQDFHSAYPTLPIAVDGGVSEDNIEALAAAGAVSFTAGSAIAKATDPEATYQHLLSLANGV